MIDFGAIRKFIYFPKKHERIATPYVIYVLDKWGLNWRGHVTMESLVAKNFTYYAMVRCQPFSESLWNQCMEWVAKRDLLEAEYIQLMNGGSHDKNQ